MLDEILAEIGRRLGEKVKDLRIEDLTDDEIYRILAGSITPELQAKLERVDFSINRIVGLSEQELEGIIND